MPSRLPLAGLASQARLVCRQQTCCGRAFVAWGKGVSARGPPAALRAAASGSHQSASSRRRRRRPPPTSAARRPSTPPGRAADRPDDATSDHHRPPTPTTSLADHRRRGHRCDPASKLVAARGPRPWPGVSLRVVVRTTLYGVWMYISHYFLVYSFRPQFIACLSGPFL